jgi:murein DD-endopeptidase MepM/ murein hydrolase activator NlpD
MTPRPMPTLAAVAFASLSCTLLGAAPPAAPTAPILVWPVACRLGVDCEIQHYVDRDPSSGVKDYTCGNRTYDGHDGVDIRLPDLAAQRRGVAVLAAADGRVRGIRDGMVDGALTAGGPQSVKDRECGNGLIIDHTDGFETQYCHLAQGSLKVKAGDMVKAGALLGRVGESGLAEFPHLHFTVRQTQKVVDPFAFGAAPGTCGPGRSLWAQTPAYQARIVLNTGFATGPLTMEAVENGTANAPAQADRPNLVAYARAIGLKAGDVQALTVRAPDGSVLIQNQAEPLPRDQAQRLMFAGKRRPPQGWPKGRYAARYTVSAGGKVVLTRDFALAL